jgi:SRSO17 transposase
MPAHGGSRPSLGVVDGRRTRCDLVRWYALETLADADAVLAVDETVFLKRGKASCGVGRQFTGSAGEITNCRVGVFATYASRHGNALIDRALYLPMARTDEPARVAGAHVPQEVGFAAKPRLAGRMVERAIAAGVPFAWVTGDSVHGAGGTEMALRRAGKGCVLGINATQPFNSWIASQRSPGPPSRSRKVSSPPPGSACPRARARRDRGSPTGPTSSWPTWTRTSTGTARPASGHAAC